LSEIGRGVILRRDEFFDLRGREWWETGYSIRNETGEPLLERDVDAALPQYEFFHKKFDLDIPSQQKEYCQLRNAIGSGVFHLESESRAWVSKTFRRKGKLVTEVHLVTAVTYYAIIKVVKSLAQ